MRVPATSLLSLVVFIIFFFVFAADASGAEYRDPAVELLGYRILDLLETQPVPCPEEPGDEADLAIVLCGRLPIGGKRGLQEVERLVDAVMIDEGAAVPEPAGSGWTDERGVHSRSYRLGVTPLTFSIDVETRLLVLRCPPQFNECAKLPLDVPSGKEDEILPPVLLEQSRVAPTYPELARVAWVRGTVILQGIVRKDGTVGDLCVRFASRPNLGFEEAAKEAVLKWRYEPATLRGEPVDAYVTVRVDFKYEDS
jgi:TonB family protein